MSIEATSIPGAGKGVHGRRLESWKEIASYLGRDVTTIRRWEKREGLPVHRLHHSKLGSLYAFTAELDAWRDKRAPAGTTDAPLIPGLPEVVRPDAPMRRMAARAALALMLVLTLAAGLTWFMRARTNRKPASANGDLRSLAVLPLENLTGDPSQEYFADGMTDALITELAQVRGLKVISRTSVMHYKGARKTLPEIARELGVEAVVEGTVSRSGDAVKITAGSKPTINPEAYEAYLKGVYFLDKQSSDGVRTAIRYFQGAVEKDHNFAAAYSRLASCYAFLSGMSEIPYGEAYARGKEAAQKAAALDDNLDRAHTALAWIAVLDWDWPRAENEYKRAIQINPNSANAHVGYFYLLLILGKLEESTQEEQAAKVLDPLSLDTLMMSISNSYYRRQYDDGLIKARSAIERYPQVSVFHVLLSNFYAAQGKEKPAAKEILLAEETSGASPERLAALRGALQAVGPKGLRRKRIELNEKLAGKQFMNAYDIAIDSAVVGDSEQAIGWLEKALQARDSKIPLIAVEPVFDRLRSDPRFADLLRQMRLQRTHSQLS